MIKIDFDGSNHINQCLERPVQIAARALELVKELPTYCTSKTLDCYYYLIEFLSQSHKMGVATKKDCLIEITMSRRLLTVNFCSWKM